LNSKTIAITIIFSALAIALIPFKIPAIFLFGFYYRLTEIPIVTCFLIFGLKCAVSVALITTLAQLTILIDSTGIVGPLVGILTLLIMLLGLYAAQRLMKQKLLSNEHSKIKSILFLTGSGTLSRIAISPFATYLLFGLLIPLTGGPTFSNDFILGIMPFTMLFGATVSLYTIPLSYPIARLISNQMKINALT